MPQRITHILAAVTIFLSAFLLFLVEPMAARELLPVLGGSSAVWITCLVVFQLLLLAGYSYAHLLATRWTQRQAPTEPSPAQPPSRRLALLHLSLLVVALVPIALHLRGSAPDPAAAAHPVAWLFRALAASIGLPFLLLSATSPLLQVWLAQASRSAVPYRLFALSNFGSLLALAAYPTLVEPALTLHQQNQLWAAGYLLLLVMMAALLWTTTSNQSIEAIPTESSQTDALAPTTTSATLRQRLLWFIMPMAAAMQLTAVTSHLSLNIAAIPLLWVLPLGVYLITFILAFEVPGLYRRLLVVRFLAVFLGSLAWMLTRTGVGLPIAISVSFFLLELFFAAWFCHAEAFAARPSAAREATQFYLLVAAGGCVGTAFIGILCPVLFRADYDIAIAFATTAAASLFAVWHDRWPVRLLTAVGTVMLCFVMVLLHRAYELQTLAEVRNFYGPLRVRTSLYPPQAFTVHTLINGIVDHGTEWFAPEFLDHPTTYYAPDSGIGLTLANCCFGHARSVGVIGLGTGTIAAYGQPGDSFRFYEINPAVEPLAENLFTYLRHSKATVSIVTGDARLSLAAETADAPAMDSTKLDKTTMPSMTGTASKTTSPHHPPFDVLAVDAFTGDAIPLHLLTREALALYRRHLAPGGVIAFHVSNQYLDLAPEIALLAASANMRAILIQAPSHEPTGAYASTWVLVTDSAEFLRQPPVFNAAQPIAPRPGLRLWTDDYSSLLPILHWTGNDQAAASPVR